MEQKDSDELIFTARKYVYINLPGFTLSDLAECFMAGDVNIEFQRTCTACFLSAEEGK